MKPSKQLVRGQPQPSPEPPAAAIAEARRLAGTGQWNAAFAAFLDADRLQPLEAGDLDRLATAAYLTGRDAEFQQILERLHRLHVAAGDRRAAGRCAFWLGLSLLLRGDVGQANAWRARGEEDIGALDCAERGYLLLPVAEAQLRAGNLEAAAATAGEACAAGERWHDPDLTAAARHLGGRALIAQGQVRPGLALLDRTMLAVVAGELSPIMTGLMYCSVIEACGEVHAIGRAHEWTSALGRWCDQQSEMIAFTGTCLVHRAAIMQLRGRWPDALAEAGRATERARRSARRPPGAAAYQQGEIHRLRGEFAEAEVAYRAASQLGCEPYPGLALLRLAQGRIGAAAAAMRRLVTATAEPLRRTRLLPSHIEIMLAAGHADEGRAACRELETLAELCDADLLWAVTAQAQGAIALGDGEPNAAIGPLRRAFEIWTRLEAPYESARVRVLIGQACRLLGDEETAGLEFEAARLTFDALGAGPDRARLEALAGGPAPPPGPLTAREREVLRLIAAGRTNKAIAGKLCLSERTVDRHVSNILNKLDVPSRTAATAYAYAHRLL